MIISNIIRKVTFDTKVNGNASDITTINVMDGEKATPPAEPEKEGYTFAGWFDENDNSGFRFIFTSVIREDKNLYAVWIENVNGIDVSLEAPEVGDTVTIMDDGEPDSYPNVESNMHI